MNKLNKETITEVNKLVKTLFESQKQKLKEELIDDIKIDLRSEVLRFVEGVGKEIIIEELKKIDVPNELRKRLDEILTSRFKPIIEGAYRYVNAKHRKKILTYLNSLSNLKTSTINEIKEEIKRTPITEAPEIADEILKNFPEYDEAIKKLTKK